MVSLPSRLMNMAVPVTFFHLDMAREGLANLLRTEVAAVASGATLPCTPGNPAPLTATPGTPEADAKGATENRKYKFQLIVLGHSIDKNKKFTMLILK